MRGELSSGDRRQGLSWHDAVMGRQPLGIKLFSEESETGESCVIGLELLVFLNPQTEFENLPEPKLSTFQLQAVR